MLVAIILISFGICPLNNALITEVKQSNNKILVECVGNIIREYFYNYSIITYLDLYYDSDEIYKAIHDLKSINVLQRDNLKAASKIDESYLIASSNTSTVINVLPILKKEPSWNPNTKYLLIIKNLAKEELKEIFDLLMKLHILNILILNSTDTYIYTYNPYENYGCGRRYERIIEYGQCLMAKATNLYPKKLVTGLKNCTIRVTSPHWPPYSIDPAKRSGSDEGVEEFVLRQMGKLEQFSVKFNYTNDAETFTLIKSDMAAVGPMNLIQKDVTDAVLGGMILTDARAQAFSYIYGHLSYTDEFRYQVQKAQPVPSWKYMYLEFETITWIIFLVTFLTFFFMFVILVRPEDKVGVLFIMFRYLFLNGTRIRGTYFTKYFFLMWVLFAYLINTYYVSSFVSLATNQPISYQISTVQDLHDYNLKPCVGVLMRSYFLSIENITISKNVRKHCNGLLESIKTVSSSSDVYTVILYSIYKYKRNQFYNEFGSPTTYSFPKPLSKIVYAIYLYKGFPMVKKLTKIAVRLADSGLIEYYLQYLHHRNEYKNKNFSEKMSMYRIETPWHILIVGYLISGIVFLLEIIISKKFCARKMVLPLQRVIK